MAILKSVSENAKQKAAEIIRNDPQKNLLDELQRLEKEYNESIKLKPSAPEIIGNPDLQKRSADELLSDGEIEARAKGVLEGEYATGIQKIEDDFKKNSLNINNKADNNIFEHEADIDKINSRHDDMQSSLKSSAIRQGIARSSILTEAGKVLDESRMAELNNAYDLMTARAAALTAELALVTEKLNTSLSNFEIAHAAKLQAKIDSLKDVRAKQEQDIIKFNNKVELDLANYLLKEADLISKERQNLENLAIKANQEEHRNGYYGDKEVNYQMRYEAAKDYFNNLSKEDAAKVLNQMTELEHYLGDYYAKLRAYVLTRKD